MPQIDDVVALRLLLLVDAIRMWISWTTEGNDDSRDSDFTCTGGNMSCLLQISCLSLFSVFTLHASPVCRDKKYFEATELISIVFGSCGLH